MIEVYWLDKNISNICYDLDYWHAVIDNVNRRILFRNNLDGHIEYIYFADVKKLKVSE